MSTSDFSLFPIKKIGNPNFQYRVATWPLIVEQDVHDLFDGIRIDPITYTRTTWRTKMTQRCKIEIDKDHGVVMRPGNGFDYIIRRDSEINKEFDKYKLMYKKKYDDGFDISVSKKPIPVDGSVPHNIKCAICLTNKRTHIIQECNHVIACEDCAKEMQKMAKYTKKCPMCRKTFKKPLKKIYF